MASLKNKMFKYLSNKNVLFVLRLILGLIFVIASADKIVEPLHFKAVLQEYNILPQMFVPLFAVIFPWIELLCGLMLILDVYAQSNALVCIGSLFMFTIAISLNLYNGIIHDCGCFDLLGIKEEISLIVVFRDIIFILLAIPVLLYSNNRLLGKKLR